MGNASAPEVVALAKEAITQAEYVQKVEERFVGESGFMLFYEIDHGGWLPRFGINRRTVRWILGNPLIAITMIRHNITAGLFGGPGDREGERTGHDNRLRAPIVSHGHRGEPSATRSRKSARREVRRLDRQGDRRLKEDSQ
jgi:hypothetical protein